MTFLKSPAVTCDRPFCDRTNQDVKDGRELKNQVSTLFVLSGVSSIPPQKGCQGIHFSLGWLGECNPPWWWNEDFNTRIPSHSSPWQAEIRFWRNSVTSSVGQSSIFPVRLDLNIGRKVKLMQSQLSSSRRDMSKCHL